MPQIMSVNISSCYKGQLDRPGVERVDASENRALFGEIPRVCCVVCQLCDDAHDEYNVLFDYGQSMEFQNSKGIVAKDKPE